MDEDLPKGFEALQYIAGYTDLAQALGLDVAAGEAHYLQYGRAEGREIDAFDERQYLVNYGDLRAALGSAGDATPDLAAAHFIQFGLDEGRTDDPLPPPDDFDGLQYIASYGDLIEELGADAAAGAEHYVRYGRGEDRVTDSFDEEQYLRNYADLREAFGDDPDDGTAGALATQHYIYYGYAEGRTDDPVPGAAPSSLDFIV
jgi:hypothetical protein